MKFDKAYRNLLFALFIIYYAQGSLYSAGSIFSQGALALIFAVSIIYFFKTWFQNGKKDPFYKTWTALLLLNSVGFVFADSLSNTLFVSMFKGIIMASLPFYPFYYFAQRGMLKSKHLIVFFLILLPLTIMQYFLNSSQILDARISDKTDVVNNIAYSFVALIPFVFLFNRKKVASITAMIVLLFFIIQGAKRGALISGIIGLLIFIYFQLKSIERKNKFKSYLMIIGGLIAMSYYVYNVFQNNEFLISRLQSIGEEDGTSGRNVIYENIFNSWVSSDSYLHLLFGFGFAASLNFSGTGNFAHNDWLELLSNFGLLGVMVYATLFYTVVKKIKSGHFAIDKKLLLIAIVCIWFFTSLVSMSYTSNTGYVQAIMLAYLIGTPSKNLD